MADVATGTAEDFVIATGVQYSVCKFVEFVAKELGITLHFEGQGVDDKAYVATVTGDNAPGVKVDDLVVAVDPLNSRSLAV